MYLVSEEVIEKLVDRFLIEREAISGEHLRVEITNINQRSPMTYNAIFISSNDKIEYERKWEEVSDNSSKFPWMILLIVFGSIAGLILMFLLVRFLYMMWEK